MPVTTLELRPHDGVLVFALRIPRVGIKAHFRWDGIKLGVATRINGRIYTFFVHTVSRTETEIIELVLTFLINKEDLIDAVNRKQFETLISGVETLHVAGIIHQYLTDVEYVWTTTGEAAWLQKEDDARWNWVRDTTPAVEWRRGRN